MDLGGQALRRIGHARANGNGDPSTAVGTATPAAIARRVTPFVTVAVASSDCRLRPPLSDARYPGRHARPRARSPAARVRWLAPRSTRHRPAGPSRRPCDRRGRRRRRIASSRPGGLGLLEHLGKDDHLHRALEVLERGHAHRRAGLGDHPANLGHDATDHHALLVELLPHLAAVGVDVLADHPGQLAQRVVGQVQPEQLLLPAQALARRCLGDAIRQRPLEHGRVRRRCRTATPGR